ncbi:MAG: hypothetical protein AMXMBFR23_21990 [Chloroflexota bacterium]
MLTLEEFKQLDALTVRRGYPDALMQEILPYYNLITAAGEKLRTVDLSETPPALVYRAGSVK